MPEKPPKKQNEEKESLKNEPDSWENDQKEKSYYYDDACGYEVYDPEKDEDDAED